MKYSSTARLLLMVGLFFFAVVLPPMDAHAAAGAYEWTMETVPSRANLRSVWGASPSAVFAVGDSSTVLRFDGTSWSKMSFPVPNLTLVDVWGASATDVYALADYRLFHYDGSAWSLFAKQPFVPGFVANALWGTSPNHIIVVGTGSSGTMGPIRVWNGSQWSSPITGGAGGFTDVWGTASDNVFVSNGSGTMLHTIVCGGQLSWQLVTTGRGNIRGIWGANATNVCVATYEGISRRIGEPDVSCFEPWTYEGNFVTLAGIWGRAADEIYAVGWAAGLSIGCYIQRYNGTQWVLSPVPEGPGGMTGPAHLQAVWGDPSGSFWAVGDRGVVMRKGTSAPDTSLVVNSSDCASDRDPGDGVCDTGRVNADGKPECTLCAAIQEANADPDVNVVRFGVTSSDPGYRPATASVVINVSPPAITSPVVLDATTQPGWSGRPVIELDGRGRLSGFQIQGGGVTLRGFAIRGYQGAGVDISGPGGNAIEACYIGTDVTGAFADSNRWGVIVHNSPNNRIGGVGTAGNVISGNMLSGVTIEGAASVGNRVAGNRIGLGADGSRAIPNRFHGVLVQDGASATEIGGATSAARNLIAGNRDHGIAVRDANGTVIAANWIGVDATGLLARGNEKGGIVVEERCVGTRIGGGAQQGNLVSANRGDAIALLGAEVVDATVHGNRIGVTATETGPLGNAGIGVRFQDGRQLRVGDLLTPGSGNTIANGTGFGVRIQGATVRDVKIEGNLIGLAGPDTTPALNVAGAVQIEGGVEDVTIGGLERERWNHLYGNVAVVGANTRKVRLLGNDLEVPADWMNGGRFQLPFDLGNDGPSCNCGGESGLPNGGPKVPHLLAIGANAVEGMTTPNATVFVYQASDTGSGTARYFARSLRALGHAAADAQGHFSVSVSLTNGMLVTAIATDAEGNSSEAIQLKRPVIFAHGIGGAWLRAPDGSDVWLPDGINSYGQNAQLKRMAFHPNGVSVEQITAPEMLESLFDSRLVRVVYGPVMDWLAAHGYEGKPHNVDMARHDAWRFYYDWRRSPADAAKDFRALVDRITGGGEDLTRTCDVDIVAHSNGCLVTGVYIKGEPAHSRCRVHRYVTMGAPFLGTPLAAGAHTRGYIFGLEQELLYGNVFNGLVEWGDMLGMARNLPAGYALMPGEKFWNANAGNSPRHYLEDLHGNPLTSHRATQQFLANPKTDAQGNALGLDRNAAMWSRELSRVHSLTDDWRDYQGPPQAFRVVGSMPAGTIQSWTTRLGSRPSKLFYPLANTYTRYERGDTYEHWAYRNALTPVLGAGDGTVLLSSATLGHVPAGGTDYSGVGRSEWIEDFSYYPCKHNDLIVPKCTNGNLPSLAYVTRALIGGYQMLDDFPAATRDVAAASALTRTTGVVDRVEMFYVFGSAPIRVWVTDDSSRVTGPQALADSGKVVYQLPDIEYWSGLQWACVSLPRDQRYTLTIDARSGAEVQVVRIVTDGNADNRNLFFPATSLSASGVLKFTAEAGGAPETSPLGLDSDGDGSFESAITPAGTAVSAWPAPAIPMPAPYVVQAVGYRSDTAARTVAVHFPDVGGPVWQWSLPSHASWYTTGASSGATPDSLVLSFDATGLAAGTYTDSLDVTLQLGAFTRSARVEVELIVREAPSVASLSLTPEYVVLRPGDRHSFAALGLDESGVTLAVTPSWSAEGGSIDANGEFTAGAYSGIYFVTASSGGAEAEAMVEIVDGAPPPPSGSLAYALHQNAPNPATGPTLIAFDLPSPSRVRLSLYDVTGRLVEHLVDADYGAGRQSYTLASGRMPNGVYFYRVEIGAFTRTRKLVLAR